MKSKSCSLRQALRFQRPTCTVLQRRRKTKRGSAPLVSRKWWNCLPHWIALYAERGRHRKCWEGHRLLSDCQDGRRHGSCNRCGEQPRAGTPIMVCQTCRFSRCNDCLAGARLPRLSEDPLFHGPNQPCLLKPAFGDNALTGRGTVIVCPGGNYEFLCPIEGYPIAQWLVRHGIQALVLRYRLLPKYCFRDALDDLEAAVENVRRHRDGPVAAIGFSAGGHLVSSLALRLARKGRQNAEPLDAQILVYPSIDGSDWLHPWNHGFWNQDCCKNAPSLMEGQQALMGGRGFAAPPTFIVGSTSDKVCPPKEHTDVYVEALKQRDIPHHYVRGNLGEHGFGLDKSWSEACISWLQARHFGHPVKTRTWAGHLLAGRGS